LTQLRLRRLLSACALFGGQRRLVAWQYDWPEKGEGVILAFRRAGWPTDSIAVKLHGLDENATYGVRDLDNGTIARLTGTELLEGKLKIKIANKPGTALFIYHK
jgi:alpha-galactosidase